MIKKFLSGILVGFLILFLGFIAWKGNLYFSLGKERTLTVTGVGKVKMKPEVARFTVGVQKFAGEINDAMKQEKEATTNIISTLKEMGVEEEDIKTAYFSVWPQTSETYENNIRRTQITGYSVSNSVEVKVRNLDQVSSLLGKVIAAGANNVSGLSFGADEPKEQEAQAREKAIDDAREKAEKMAQAAGRKLGRIVSISEGGTASVIYPSYKEGVGAGGGGPAVETGSLEVVQTITVVFELR